MTGIILENITNINDLTMFSKAYKKGLIKVEPTQKYWTHFYRIL